VVRDHFELEKHERIPIWNFVLAATDTKGFDVEGALWTLRRFPLDMISWTVQNSHREDITKQPKNFRSQELAELLPPGERRMSRWNTHPFILDGGEGGKIEYAGDEFLLPYWMGRYLKVMGGVSLVPNPNGIPSLSPAVAESARLPWVHPARVSQPQRGCSNDDEGRDATPLG